jgi:hypothetical protein
MCLNSYQITEFTDQGLNISVRWIKFMFRLISVKKKGADLIRPLFYFVLEKFAKRFCSLPDGERKEIKDFI